MTKKKWYHFNAGGVIGWTGMSPDNRKRTANIEGMAINFLSDSKKTGVIRKSDTVENIEIVELVEHLIGIGKNPKIVRKNARISGATRGTGAIRLFFRR